MADKEETGGGEQDDVSFLRTGDIVALTCIASHPKDGAVGSERVCLSTEGFGNRMCTLENVSDKVKNVIFALSDFKWLFRIVHRMLQCACYISIMHFLFEPYKK
jgi:hypothetical protein